MVSSIISARYFLLLTAFCIVGRTCSFVPTSVSSSTSSAKSFISPRPYKGACTSLQQSSSPSSSRSRPYSSNKGYKKKQQTRNRGANQANHNRRGHEFRLNKDSGGGGRGSGGGRQRVRKTNTKRPPRWEREGDNLYQEVSKQHEYLQLLAEKRVSTVQDVCDVLAPWMTANNSDEKSGEDNDDEIQEPEPAQPKEEKKSPPFLWGTLPVGPVIASRLRSSDRPSPTSVQSAAFTMLTATQSKNNKKVPTKRSNAIIASPTGTGKTLAYLLPLLSTSPGGQKGEGTGGVLIVTPTIELACQIQREVDTLWPPSEGGQSSLFVVGANDMNASGGDEDDEEEDVWSQGRIILRSISGNSPLIAGTPKMLRMLYREAENIVKRPDDVHPFTKEERETSVALLSNLRAIVLDEADRLLRTEAVARETAERKQRKIAQQKRAEAEEFALSNNVRPPPPPKKKRFIVARQTQTELLLRDLPVVSLDDVQIICASATIGRTMRRQLMQILGAPSADAAAALITGDEDARVKSKDAEKRKSVLLPEKLQHAFKVVDISNIDAGDKDVDTDDSDLSVAERNEERRIAATIQGMWDTMVKMEVAKPTIIFPGRVGVERVEDELKALGLEDVRTLRNLSGDSHEAISGNAEDNATGTNEWKNVPVYIIGERFARGLDLPEVGNVILLAPPSSAAGYAHMAGRTGRSGREGTAITLVRPRNTEVQRLAAIAETLGLKFKEELSSVA